MTQAVLIESLQRATGLPAIHAKTGVQAVVDTIESSLKQTGTFTLPGFGTFSVHRRDARKARNPRTGETVKVGVTKTVRFKASPTLKKGMARATVA